MKKSRAAIISITLSLLLLHSTQIQAGQIRLWSMDYLMINSAGAIAADITFDTTSPKTATYNPAESKHLSEIKMNFANIKTAYWNHEQTIQENAVISWPASQRADDGNHATLHNHRGKIKSGNRYLLILSAHQWTDSPLSDGVVGIYEVDLKSNVVKCAGGEIYSVNDLGIICSNQKQQPGQPLTESQVLNALTNQHTKSRKRNNHNSKKESPWNQQPYSPNQ